MVVQKTSKERRRMKGPGNKTRPGRYDEEIDGDASRQPPRATASCEEAHEMAGDDNQQNINETDSEADVEGQVAGGVTTTTRTTPADEDDATVALQVDAYVVGEPQRQAATMTRSTIEATVIQNETHVEAQTRRLYRRSIVLFVVAVSTTLAIVFPLTRQDDNGEHLKTPSPTSAPEGKDPWLILQPIIEAEGSRNDTIIAQMAYRWLTVDDESGILDDPYTPEWRIVQRFVLANFYFATNGTAWWNQLRFLSKDDECTWKERIDYYDTSGASDGYNVKSLPAGVIRCDTQGRVESLRIAQNGIQSTIPSALRYLSGLIELDMDNMFDDGNGFNPSPIPSWLFKLTGLEVLVLTACSLSGTIPTELGLLTNLQHLWLSSNLLTGTLPVSLFETLSHLRVLSFYYNKLTGTLPTEIGQLSNLTYIELAKNELTGTLPGDWSGCSNVEFVSLHFNQFTGTLPDDWNQWTALSWLLLYQNALTGTLPDSWSAWTALTWFSSSLNALTGTLPDSWSQWAALSSLSLSQNALTGTLPDTWSQLSNLDHVYLYDNHVTGTLPPSWSKWSEISILSLYGNVLTGTLPNAWSELSNMAIAALHFNHLAGTLPDTWSQLSALSWLFIHQNALTGTLPAAWSQLVNVEIVRLDDNYLTGTLPEAYASWRNITLANFSANCFEGTIPLEYEHEWTFLQVDISEVLDVQREKCMDGDGNQTR